MGMRAVVKESDVLMPFLLENFSQEMSRTRLRELLKRGAVFVNGRAESRHDASLKPGDEVSLLSRRETTLHAEPLFGVRIVYVDEALVVIDKPSGLLTIATEKIQQRTAIYAVNDWLRDRKEKEAAKIKGRAPRVMRKQVFVVHRLDRDASGLLVFARTPEVKEVLQTGWSAAVKKYAALVEGHPSPAEGTLMSYLKENSRLRVYGSPDNRGGGKRSVTHYRTLQTYAGAALLEVTLETGRKHQIRVHLAEAGHPIAGDTEYGALTNPAGRLALHACSLSFPHPDTGEVRVFSSPVPSVFRKACGPGIRS